jgi:ElaB/YqjD/DUF883 family membrane-anchored ribosome-binding protein
MPSFTDDNVRKLKNTAQGVGNDIADGVNDAKGDLEDAAHRAGRKIHNLFDSASDEFSHATDTVTRQIKDKPVQSVWIALGVGYVLGKLMGR